MLDQGFTVSGKGPMVVFLHSSLSSSKQWASLANELSKNFTCINIDLLGYGNASFPQVAEYNFEVEASRIIDIVDSVNVNGKFHLIGHSCGGAIALKIAVEQSHKLLSLALFEPVAFHLLAQSTNNEHQQFATHVKKFADEIALGENSKGTETFVDFWNGTGFYANLPIKVQTIMAAQFEKVKLDFVGIFHETYTIANLKNIQCPCLVMYGKYTQQVSKELSHTIVDALDSVTVEEVDAGHMAPISHPQLMFPFISSFIYQGK
ncbi:alpha/beta hydrolase [Colwellia sp. 1_MG-2023]|uniref:alpha/beta fold hydrolase n=1 Tax=Colwellia sp. 1_MG-2023 TaxID=3062649 RepID=UPI0026E25183|nr:alpha/beta hydrolase [Colwellia sp. 1_MG-2023]MDO6445775.1 alpha/beta hydrolase [Colwellia sp. 1_MG-2023]